MAFVYPDFKTALLGSFNSGEMVAAREVTVAAYDRESDSLTFEPPKHPSTIFTYDPAEGDNMSSEPMLKDPYESRLAEIRQSTIPKVRNTSYRSVTKSSNIIASSLSCCRLDKASSFCDPSPTTPSWRTSTESG